MNSNPWNVGSINEFSYLNCPECDFHTKEKKDFQDHATRCLPCTICKKGATKATVHKKLKLFQCSVCDHKTSSKGNMKSHINSRHVGLDIEIVYLGDKNH